jgi:hypothetical protein
MTSGRSNLPDPLFCAPCPASPDRILECPEFQLGLSAGGYRRLVRCRYFVVEVTDQGPVPGCIKAKVSEVSRRNAVGDLPRDS